MKAYDLRTDKGRQSFYTSTVWRNIRLFKLSENPLCEICSTEEHPVAAKEVHHKQRITDYPTWFEATKLKHLQSLCKSCHSSITIAENNYNKQDFKIAQPMWKR